MNKTILGIIFIVISALCYGFLPIFNKFCFNAGLSLSSLLLYRFAITTSLFLILTFINRTPLKIPLKIYFQKYLVAGIFYIAIAALYTSSINYISISLAALIMYLYPIFIYGYCIIFKKENVTKKSIASLLLVIFGLYLVIGTSIENINYIGILLALGSSIAYTLYVIWSSNALKHGSSLVSSFYVSLSSLLCVIVVSSLNNTIVLINFSKESLIPVLLVSIISTFLAVLFYFKSLSLLGELKTSVLATLELVFAVVFASFFFNESMNYIQICGGIVLLFGIIGVMIYNEK